VRFTQVGVELFAANGVATICTAVRRRFYQRVSGAPKQHRSRDLFSRHWLCYIGPFTPRTQTPAIKFLPAITNRPACCIGDAQQARSGGCGGHSRGLLVSPGRMAGTSPIVADLATIANHNTPLQVRLGPKRRLMAIGGGKSNAANRVDNSLSDSSIGYLRRCSKPRTVSQAVAPGRAPCVLNAFAASQPFQRQQ